jgi:predicted N-acetyltransferase YhbS
VARRDAFDGDPVPIVLVARLGVDKPSQSKGLGSLLLHSACQGVLAVTENVGVRTMVVDGRGDASDFYGSVGFLTMPDNRSRRYLHVKDLKLSLSC